MNIKLMSVSASLFLIMACPMIMAQRLNIKMDDGSEDHLTIPVIRTLGLSSTQLLINFRSGTLNGIDLSMIRKLTFDTTKTVGSTLNLQNITTTNGSNSCFNAFDSIFVAGDGTSFEVENGGSVTLIAGLSIFIHPGMIVHEGGYLWAYISPDGPFCQTTSQTKTSQTPETPVNPEITSRLTVFPNPASSTITIKGIPVNATSITIFRSDGQTAATQKVSSDETIVDVRHLEAGLYLVNALGATTKFIKL